MQKKKKGGGRMKIRGGNLILTYGEALTVNCALWDAAAFSEELGYKETSSGQRRMAKEMYFIIQKMEKAIAAKKQAS